MMERDDYIKALEGFSENLRNSLDVTQRVIARLKATPNSLVNASILTILNDGILEGISRQASLASCVLSHHYTNALSR